MALSVATENNGRATYALPPCESGFVQRTMDPSHLNAVANHPDVRPRLAGEGELDLTPLVEDVNNVAYVTPHGGFVVVAVGYARYEVHSLFLPSAPGGHTVRAMKAARDDIFSRTDCLELVTKVREGNRPAAALAQLADFEPRFSSAFSPHDATPTTFLGLTIDRWALRSSLPGQMGHWFHQSLTDAKQRAGSGLPVHPDDPIHDAMAGAAVLMLRDGQARKAVSFYNAWARWAGYGTIQLLRDLPTVLDIGDAIIEAHDGRMEVLLCR